MTDQPTEHPDGIAEPVSDQGTGAVRRIVLSADVEGHVVEVHMYAVGLDAFDTVRAAHAITNGQRLAAVLHDLDPDRLAALAHQEEHRG